MKSSKSVDKTKVIRIFETFSGIGALHKAVTNLKDDIFKIAQTSEWDARAIISYACIHHKKRFESQIKKINLWNESQIDQYLDNYTFSLDSKKSSKINRKPRNFKVNLIAANMVSTNLPNIKGVKGENLKNINLLSYSFPCQGLSIANMGRGKGMKPNSTSTSSLVWEIHRIINEAEKANLELPKYLLLENVVNLTSKKHEKDYKKWTNFLKSKGYKTKTMILNGINHRSIQKRRRVLAISILNWKDKTPDKKFQDLFVEKFGKKLSKSLRYKKYHRILSSSDSFPDEIQIAIPNATPSRLKMLKENSDLLKRDWHKQDNWTFRTLTTKQDRHPNVGMITLSSDFLKKGKLSKRFVTHREAYQIMGFNSKDFERVKSKHNESILTSETLYRQAGNSIIVSVLEDVLKFIANYERGVIWK